MATANPPLTNTSPQPPTAPPLRNALQMLRFFNRFDKDPLGMLDEMFQQYGAFWRIQIGSEWVYFTHHPEAMREVLVTKSHAFIKDSGYTDEMRGLARFGGQGLLNSNGDFWRKQRKLVAPAFHTQRINEYAEVMVRYGQEQMATWHDGETRDIAHDMMNTTLAIVGRTLFDVNVAEYVNSIEHGMHVINKHAGERSILPPWFPRWADLSINRAVRDLDEVVYGIIAERRRTQIDKGDLLSMLLMAQDESGQGMTDKQVRDEAITLFLAGHETTANTLNWTWYLLAQHPDVRAKLHEELDAILEGRTPTLADLPQLPYTEQIIKESMRLYPPAWNVGRQTTEAVDIMGYTVPADSNFRLAFYHMHRHEDWWQDAQEFMPERFAPDKAIEKYHYLPFGAGLRVCIGNSFAMMEAQLLLATFAQQWELTLAPDANVIPEPRITMFPRHGLSMRLKRR